MAGGGYESDLDLNNVKLIGDFPIEHSLGGHGIANSPQANKYTVALHPAITQYRIGMPLHIIFAVANTGSATLNVNNQGEIVLKKIASEFELDGDGLTDIDAGDITPGRVYLLVFDGQFFQVVNLDAPVLIAFPIATESSRGLIEIATQAETDAGTDNQRAVTPLKLTQYIANKITGLWEDKGLLDCTMNGDYPDYPPGQKGDAYTVSLPGKIGGNNGIDVQVRDVIYCTMDNPGGTEAAVGSSWNVIQGNLVQATVLIAGIARIATQAEVTSGTDDTKFITPLKLITYLNSRTKMRTQLRFYSESLPESEVAGAGSVDYHFGIIAVSGIPAGATIKQATLIWEGNLMNSSGSKNAFATGNLSLSKDGGLFSNYVSVAGKIHLDPAQITFHRFVEDNVTNKVIGNGTYLAKLAAMRSDFYSIFISGHWILEIDYES
ncbi:MAG: hypothetical protein AB7P01_18800 [Bacteroidia bacterium]